MAILQILVLSALTAGVISCLLRICRSVERLSDAIFSVRLELTKMNGKLAAIEVEEPDPFYKAAIRDIEQSARPNA